MKKVFKGSLLAASVAMAFGAQAADISSTPVQLSEQGLNVEEFAEAVIKFDVVVSKEHPSASEITLTLSENVDLAANGVTGGACIQTPADGIGECGDVAFDYGTGSFTFDSVVVDDEENTITFNVNLGNPLTANSAFRVYIGAHNIGANNGTNDPIMKGASSVDYYAETAGGDFIEDGSSSISTVVDQFSASVQTDLDAVIKRTAPRDAFVSNFDNASDQEDHLTLAFSDNSALVNSATVTGASLVLKATDITDTTTHVAAAWTSANTAGPSVIDNVNGTVTLPITQAEWATIVGNETETLEFIKQNAGETLDPSSFTVSVEVDYEDSTSTNSDTDSTLVDADAGEWRLDAAVVNVPYLPVNYGLTPNVEIANEGNTDAEIIVEAIDNKGNELGPVTLDFKADAKTVTKVSEADLDEAFGLEGASRKMSVTFIIDANEADVTLAPYYRENESRINVITDQYKGQ